MITGVVDGQSRQFTSWGAIEAHREDITVLDIANEDLPDEFAFPDHMQVLELFRCRNVDSVGVLPPFVTNVRIRESMLSRCSHLVGELNVGLESVVITDCVLDSVEAGWPPNLVHMDVSHNKLRDLPMEFPASLRTLDVTSNSFSKFPRYLGVAPAELVVRICPNHTLAMVYSNGGLDSDYYDTDTRQAVLRYWGRGHEVRLNAIRGGAAQQVAPQGPRGHLPAHLSDDRQNVHATSIQDSMADSVAVVLSHAPWRNSGWRRKTLPTALVEDIYTTMLQAGVSIKRADTIKKTLHNDVMVKTVASRSGVTYLQLLQHVWGIMSNLETKLELTKTLAEEVEDGRMMCFTGRFTRLLNTLCGVIDGVQLQISLNEQIGTYVSTALRKLEGTYADIRDVEEEEKEECYTSDAQAAVVGILQELEVPEVDWLSWLSAL